MNARRVWVLAIAGMLLAGCAGGSASRPNPANAVESSGKTVEEVRAQVEKTMTAFAALDLDAFKAALAEDVVAYEIDSENKPVRLESRAEVSRWTKSIFGQLKAMGAATRLDFASIDCRAAGALAYCVADFTFTVTMPNGKALSQPSRNSIVLRKEVGGWKWAHWHSSVGSKGIQGESR
jgi:ketosteroid isomerase-like protein